MVLVYGYRAGTFRELGFGLQNSCLFESKLHTGSTFGATPKRFARNQMGQGQLKDQLSVSAAGLLFGIGILSGG